MAKKVTTFCNGSPQVIKPTSVHHHQPETKQKSMQWKHPSSPFAKKFRTQPLPGKLMLTVFWDSQEPILETYQERGKAVTSA
jgi:hypothetical protein